MRCSCLVNFAELLIPPSMLEVWGHSSGLYPLLGNTKCHCLLYSIIQHFGYTKVFSGALKLYNWVSHCARFLLACWKGPLIFPLSYCPQCHYIVPLNILSHLSKFVLGTWQLVTLPVTWPSQLWPRFFLVLCYFYRSLFFILLSQNDFLASLVHNICFLRSL